MRRLLLLLCLVGALAGPLPLYAEAGGLHPAYERLRDATYDDEPLPRIETLYSGALAALLAARLAQPEDGLWRSRIEYLMGRAYQNREQKQAAAEHYERGLAQAEAVLAEAEVSDGWRMRSENLSQLCLVKELGFLLANGTKVGQYAEKALELDPRNAAAQIILASGKIYPPPLFGGNPRRGIHMMQQALVLGAAQKDDLFNIYSGIGLAHSKLREREEARKWFARALEVFPNNRYVNEQMAGLDD
jgi:tetratricopeptide (TPR) repeat protein